MGNFIRSQLGYYMRIAFVLVLIRFSVIAIIFETLSLHVSPGGGGGAGGGGVVGFLFIF